MGYGVNGLHGASALVIAISVYNLDGAIVTMANNL